MQLAVPDVERVDAPCTAREQDLGKSTGRSADIEADAPCGIKAEMVERRRKLHAAARDVRMRRLGAQHRIGRDFVRSLGDDHVVRRHPAGRDRGLRLGAALEQAALDQQAIDALARQPIEFHGLRYVHALERPRPGQRDVRRVRHRHRRLVAFLANVPLAHPVAAAALDQVHVHVVLVVAVGARTQHGGEARAGRLLQALANVLGDARAGQLDELAVGELERAHVERIRLAMLGELRADHPVAPAAIVGRVVVDALELRAERTNGRRHVLAHPARDGLRETAAHDGGRRHGDPRLVGENDGLEPHHVLGAARLRHLRGAAARSRPRAWRSIAGSRRMAPALPAPARARPKPRAPAGAAAAEWFRRPRSRTPPPAQRWHKRMSSGQRERFES